MSCNLGQQTKKTARVRNLISACLMAVTFFTASVFAKDGRPGLQVIAEVKHDTSLSLRDMESSVASQATAAPRRVMPLLLPHPATGGASVQADTALQKTDWPFVSASLGLNFDGLGQGQNGFVVNAAPPDTNGVVGTMQYVQWVNSSFAVFDKATGARLMGPTAGNAFWAGFGGGCQSNNDGDPVIQYDKMANRWVATQFSVSTTPFLQCVAVSTTNDATGSYNRYAFTLPNFNDYPKLGIWPDGYYFSFNMFNAAGTIFFGADACAANRTAMLAGNAATMICFQQSSNVASVLPSDTDGIIKPASGEPAFFMNFGTNSLNLWKFHVDFTTTADTRWMGSIAMDQAGDIALGYSESSGNVRPSVFFTGREPSDPAGALQSEATIVNGTGSQTGGLSRWGDYSAMTVDPVDDCTFWYTQEYMTTTGSFNWNTRIATVKFPNCGSGSGGPAVTLSVTSLAFGKRVLGTTSTAKIVKLTNTGSGTLNISSIINNGDFAISAKTCGTTVAAGTSCTVSVTFTPTVIGIRNGTLTFNDDASTNPQKVALTGTGTQISLSPVSLNFGTVAVGATSAAKSVTVTNVGTTTVTFTGFSIAGTNPGDYLVSGKTCGTSLAGGGSCTVSLRFKPTATGTRKANVRVADNGGGSPQSASLTGVGQ